MNFTANDITQLSDLLNQHNDDAQPQKGVYKTESLLNPGTLGETSQKKVSAQPNHKIKATINRPKSPSKTFNPNGRKEPEHEVIFLKKIFCFLICLGDLQTNFESRRSLSWVYG
jgi:hypothetical protein